MATSGIQFKVFGDAAAAEKAIVALEKKYADLENKVRHVSRSSKKGTEEGVSGFQQVARHAGQLIGTYLSLQTVLQGVSAWYRAIRQDIDEATASTAKFNRDLAQTLLLSGDAAAGPAVKSRLQSMPVLEAQAAAAFAGAKAGAPGMNPMQAVAIAEALAPLAPVLAPLDESGKLTNTAALTELAQLMGQLGELSPGTGAGDLADMALFLQQNAGDRISKLTSPGTERGLRAMMAEGMSFEESIATALVGIGAGKETRQLATKEGREGLDQAELAATIAGISGAVKDDLRMQQARMLSAQFPEQFGRTDVFARDEKDDRAFAEFMAARDVGQQAYVEGGPRGQRFFRQSFVSFEDLLLSLGIGEGATGSQVAKEMPIIQERVAKALEENNERLEENNRLMQNEQRVRPAVNRQAQGEAP